MKPRLFALLFGASAAALVACYGSDGANLDRGGEQPTPPIDHPLGAGLSATPRRISADQWRASLPILFGTGVDGKPITWLQSPGRPALSSPTVAAAFGEPDYVTTTDEDLTPSVLYAKFTDDAARSVCDQVTAADTARSDPKARVLRRYVASTDTVASNPSAVAENLRYLKLRFHGVFVKPADDATLDGLRKVLVTATNGSVASDPAAKNAEGWNAVCVALVTAPEFHIY